MARLGSPFAAGIRSFTPAQGNAFLRSETDPSRNPFLKPYSGFYGPSTFIASNWADATKAVQFDQATRQRVNDFLKASKAMDDARAVTPTGGVAGSAPTTIDSSLGPINLLKLTKGGGFGEFAEGAQREIAGTTPTYGDLRTRLATALNETPDQARIRADTEKFISNAEALQPITAAMASAQAKTLGRVYEGPEVPGSYAGELAENRRLARAADRAAGRQAADEAIGGYNVRHGVEGASSYASAELADTLGRQAIDISSRDAERAAANTNALLSAQVGTAGLPQNLLTTDLITGRIPIEARNNMIDSAIRQAAGNLQNIGVSVNIDTLTDALSVIGRKLGLSAAALRNYLESYFLGVNSPNQAFFGPNLRNPNAPPEPVYPTYSPDFSNRGPFIPPPPPAPTGFLPDSDASRISQAQTRSGLTPQDVAALQDYWLHPENYSGPPITSGTLREATVPGYYDQPPLFLNYA